VVLGRRKEDQKEEQEGRKDEDNEKQPELRRSNDKTHRLHSPYPKSNAHVLLKESDLKNAAGGNVNSAPTITKIQKLERELATMSPGKYYTGRPSGQAGSNNFRLQHTATHCNTLQHAATQCTAGSNNMRPGTSLSSENKGTKEDREVGMQSNLSPRATPSVSSKDGTQKGFLNFSSSLGTKEDREIGMQWSEFPRATPSASSKEGTEEGSPDLPCSLRKKKDRDIVPKSKTYSPATKDSFESFETFLKDKNILSSDAWKKWAQFNKDERKRRGWPYEIVNHFKMGNFTLRFAASQGASSKTPAQSCKNSEKHVEEEKEELDGGASALR